MSIGEESGYRAEPTRGRAHQNASFEYHSFYPVLNRQSLSHRRFVIGKWFSRPSFDSEFASLWFEGRLSAQKLMHQKTQNQYFAKFRPISNSSPFPLNASRNPKNPRFCKPLISSDSSPKSTQFHAYSSKQLNKNKIFKIFHSHAIQHFTENRQKISCFAQNKKNSTPPDFTQFHFTSPNST